MTQSYRAWNQVWQPVAFVHHVADQWRQCGFLFLKPDDNFKQPLYMRGNDATYFLSIEIRKVQEVQAQCSKVQKSTAQRKAEKYSAAKCRKVQRSRIKVAHLLGESHSRQARWGRINIYPGKWISFVSENRFPFVSSRRVHWCIHSMDSKLILYSLSSHLFLKDN